jgi:hypothetical protein
MLSLTTPRAVMEKTTERKSTTRENDAVKRHDKYKIYEAAAYISQCTVLQQIFS